MSLLVDSRTGAAREILLYDVTCDGKSEPGSIQALRTEMADVGNSGPSLGSALALFGASGGLLHLRLWEAFWSAFRTK